jgi:hypothetical protein
MSRIMFVVSFMPFLIDRLSKKTALPSTVPDGPQRTSILVEPKATIEQIRQPAFCLPFKKYFTVFIPRLPNRRMKNRQKEGISERSISFSCNHYGCRVGGLVLNYFKFRPAPWWVQ